MAKDYAEAINQVQQSAFFPEVMAAARARDVGALKEAIMKAGISDEMADKMSKTALEGSAVAAMCW